MKRSTFYMFMAPSLIVMLLLIVIPLVVSTFLSFNFMTFRNITAPEWVGLRNYTEVLNDAQFWQSFRFTMLFVIIAVPTKMFVGLLFAILLDQVSIRVRGIFVAAFLVPFFMVPVVGTLLFKQLFEAGGLIAWFFREVLNQRFIFNETSVKVLIFVHNVWASSPFTIIVLFAGLQTLPAEMVEASMIDGANRWNQIRKIVIPHLSSLLVFTTLISIMDSYRVFDSVFVLTERNPVYKAEVMMLYTFRTAMSVRRLGKANAMAVMMVIMILVILVPLLIRTYREQTEER
jgi:ABC-type sugar transport system permease subunit